MKYNWNLIHRKSTMVFYLLFTIPPEGGILVIGIIIIDFMETEFCTINIFRGKDYLFRGRGISC